VQESAEIFKAVLDGEGSTEQNNVVLCNAAVAIRTIKPEKSFADCFYEAEESLNSGMALRSFNRLLS
jgi:anthranilate phosphoribosyltransferase